MRPVTTDPTGSQIRTRLKAGDHVRVMSKNGDTLDLQVIALGTSSLSGELVRPGKTGQAVGSHIDLPYQDIEYLAVRRLHPVNTAYNTTLFLVLLAAGAAALAVASPLRPGWH